MLNTFWWRPADGRRNAGDEVTSDVLSAFEVEHQLTAIGASTLASTGSILNWIWARRFRFRARPLGVVGSGFMEPPAIGKIPRFCKIYSLRGYLSAHVCRGLGEDISLGDPGLLLSRLHSSAPKNSERPFQYGLIPHHSKFDERSGWHNSASLSNALVIDMRTSDTRAIARQMRSCEVIISEGLHGLIFADSLGIPNVWLDDGPLHGGYRFKFHDYFSTIGRPFNRKISARQLSRSDIVAGASFELAHDELTPIQDNIIGAYSAFFRDFGIRAESSRLSGLRAE